MTFLRIGLIIMKRKIELYLPRAIYREEIIDRAIFDYRSICTILKINQHRGVLCIFKRSVTDLELTANEFSNYLIELSNAHGEL